MSNLETDLKGENIFAQLTSRLDERLSWRTAHAESRKLSYLPSRHTNTKIDHERMAILLTLKTWMRNKE
jgi:hypothetical protein